jgi:adenylate cyclase
MAGNVGWERRLAYTAIGDTANTAARLESMTKGTRHPILIADSTRASLTNGAGDLVLVGDAEIRGKQSHIRAWTLAEPPG